MQMRLFGSTFFTVLLLLSGCSVAPTYQKPDIDTPAQFKEMDPDWKLAEPGDQKKRANWWHVFNDAQLNELLTKGTEQNFALAMAISRYNATRAFLDANNAALYPQIGISAWSQENRQSARRPLRGANQPNIYDFNQISGVASYELDVWGRVSSSIDSAAALSGAALSDIETTRLLIQADIINTYFSIRGLDAQIAILNQSVDAYQKQAAIIHRRHLEGIVSGADDYRVQTLVENEKFRRAGLITKRSQLEHALALLLGQSPASFKLPVGDVYAIAVPKIPVVVPSSLLERRPDIASMERKVASSNADVGVAKTAFFPTLSLNAQLGYQNASTAQLLTKPNIFFILGPQALLTVFDGGRREALVNQALSKNSELIAQYKNTVINAFKEVEDSLAEINFRQQSEATLQKSVDYSRKNDAIAKARYKEGVASYLEIVDAALQKSQAELNLVDQRTQLLLSMSTLVKAMGGYWN